MKVIRQITYEGSEEQLVKQLKKSLPDGHYPNLCTNITVRTLTTNLFPAIQAAIDEDHGGWQGNLEAV